MVFAYEMNHNLGWSSGLLAIQWLKLEAVQYKSEEMGTGFGWEHPTQMNQTFGTNNDTPGMAGKPGELNRWWSDKGISPGRAEANYLKNNTAWVRKDMTMGPLDIHTISRLGNLLSTITAYVPGVVGLLLIRLWLHKNMRIRIAVVRRILF